MFVYYLDGCLTAYWQLFVLSLWLVTLLYIAIQVRALLRAGSVRRSLEEANFTGEAYERMKPDPGQYLRRLIAWSLLSVAILVGYASFFSTFECTPDSFLWVR